MNNIQRQSQLYAIVPAAGKSSRMHRPKLLLPFGSQRLIDRVLKAWTSTATGTTIVVVRADDKDLIDACLAWPVELVLAETAPVDMTASIRLGLQHLEQRFSPASTDGVFIAPADLPGILAENIDYLRSEHKADAVTVPRYGGRSGHPLLFPWAFTPHILNGTLPEGIKPLLSRLPCHYVDFPSKDRPTDIDTPADYEAALNSIPENPASP